MKFCLVSSGGGHIFQLLQLSKCWSTQDSFWVSFPRSDVKSLLGSKRVWYAYYPESRHLINAIKNTFLAVYILAKEKPDIVMSMGAGIAVPFMVVARIMNIHTIYIEPLDFVSEPSLTGRIVYPFVNLFLIQNKKQKRFFPRATFWGSSI